MIDIMRWKIIKKNFGRLPLKKQKQCMKILIKVIFFLNHHLNFEID